jgi:hypothetical protein
MPFLDEEESHIHSTFPALVRKLSLIRGGRITYEREPFPEPEWAEGDEPYEDLPAFTDFSSSYRLLFVECVGDDMTYEVETETFADELNLDEEDELDEDESPEIITVHGEGVVGCSVGLSLIAPFAAVDFNVMERFEDGGFTEPDLVPSVLSGGSEESSGLSDHLRSLLDPSAWRRLIAFRKRIVKTVDSHRIRVLEENELRRPLRFLRFSADVIPIDVEPTVRSALFFRTP